MTESRNSASVCAEITKLRFGVAITQRVESPDPREGEPGSNARDARGPGGERRLGGALFREDRLDVPDPDRPEPDPRAT